MKQLLKEKRIITVRWNQSYYWPVSWHTQNIFLTTLDPLFVKIITEKFYVLILQHNNYSKRCRVHSEKPNTANSSRLLAMQPTFSGCELRLKYIKNNVIAHLDIGTKVPPFRHSSEESSVCCEQVKSIGLPCLLNCLLLSQLWRWRVGMYCVISEIVWKWFDWNNKQAAFTKVCFCIDTVMS